VRDVLLAPVAGRDFAFEITAGGRAVLAGSRRLAELAAELELELAWLAEEGARLEPGSVVARASGDAHQVAMAEERLVAVIGKASGVATAAAELVAAAGGRARVVCGAWKKVPAELRPQLRHAAAVGGAGLRILDAPFVYLDKNHVRMLGGAARAVRQARALEGRAVVVQLRGEAAPIADEADAAVAEGAAVLMVDTGRVADLAAVAARRARWPQRVELAFGGGVGPANLREVLEAGADVVDVGRAILDAPMVDFRLDVR
jgi:nicotinate-nucleotide pyrophosphorylase (carboxylating)